MNLRYPGVSFCSVRHAFVFYTCQVNFYTRICCFNSFKRKEVLEDSAMSNKINLSIDFIFPLP